MSEALPPNTPVPGAGGERPQPDTVRAGESPGRRVLVVDDDPLVRWAIAETLGERGYEVTEAGDAASAMLEFSRAGHPADVVLLDPQLRDSHDLETLVSMRARSPKTPIILMTAARTPDIAWEAIHLGAFILGKPFELSSVVSLVERALTSRPS